MATQSGITISAPNAPYTIVNDIPVPALGPGKALVKSLYVGIDPVEPFMHHTGFLVTSWPAILGSDVTGVVVAASPDCTRLRVGDYVYGCVPVGLNEYSPFQEMFLVDENWIFKKAEKIGLKEACTIGSGVLTAALILLDELDMTLPAHGTPAETRDEWIILMGGSGSVGQYVSQIARIAGYKVLASCSPAKEELTLSSGATATFNYRASPADQLAAIKDITGGNFSRVVDASAQATQLSFTVLETSVASGKKYFSTVDDWSPMEAPTSVTLYRAHLGMLGRQATAEEKHVTAKIAEYVKACEPYFETGEMKALDYQLVEGKGWQAVIDALAAFEAGKFGKKPIVKVQDE